MYSYCYIYVFYLLLMFCYSVYFVVLYIVCVQMCTVLLPPGVNTIAVNKYIIS